LFIENYIKLIKDTQALPSKPLVFLMVPVFDCSALMPKYIPSTEADKICPYKEGQSMLETIKKVASKTGIPEHHIIDAYAITRGKPHGAM